MISKRKNLYSTRKGVALIVAMIFLAIFGALAVAMTSMSSTNIQSSNNQQEVANALASAQSGLECAKYLAYAVNTGSRGTFTTTTSANDDAWSKLCAKITSVGGMTIDSGTVASGFIRTSAINAGGAGTFYLELRHTAGEKSIYIKSIGTAGAATRMATIEMKMNPPILKYGVASRGRIWLAGDCKVHSSIYSSWNLSNSQLAQLTALAGQVQARLDAGTLTSTSFSSLISSLGLTLSQRTTILNQLLNGTLSPSSASSACIRQMPSPNVSPFNTTGDSRVEGMIDTIWYMDQIYKMNVNGTFATDGQAHPVYDSDGNPVLNDQGQQVTTEYLVPRDRSSPYLPWELETLKPDFSLNYDSSGSRVTNSVDEILGLYEGINYGEPIMDMPGMSIGDYDTTQYYNATLTANGGGGNISAAATPAVYSGSLDTLGTTNGTLYRNEYFPHAANSYTTGTGLKVKRWIYKNQTFTNANLPSNKNALFINCTFNGVLYVNTGQTGTTSYNNVRFDNCAFNGTIVSNTPQTFSWQQNALYFTGSATFQNDTSADATILAPHFNVNLGNSNPVAGTENVLRGAIVGGIVDVRGNAEVFGTIISMADTSMYSSGYVTNIGATLDDGGSETVAIGDIGTINITPDAENKLPSGITTPIVIKPDQSTYAEDL